MPSEHRFREIEIKLRVSSLREVHSTLRRLHAREISPRTHEFNTLYDTPSQDLRRRGQLIRLRTEHATGNSKKKRVRGPAPAILTYKGPIRSSRRGERAQAGANSRSRFKVKEEAEASVIGVDQMDRILRGLGLRPTFHYEKYRTTYLLPRIEGLKVELDETPVGDYLELEGTPSGIDRAAALLGYTRSEYIQATYGALYLADCKRRGRKPGDMLFQNAKKLR
jgi:adenylate cyclase class 2